MVASTMTNPNKLPFRPIIGTYQGYRDQNAFRFLGIPYAQAPVGNLRFVAPRQWALGNKNKGRDSSSSTVMDATEYGNVCNQFDPTGAASNESQLKDSFGAKQSEDCLYLNVFTPTLKANRVKGLPVMVFVHGGGYWSGGSSNPAYEPGNLVSRGGVVVVTLNYRLSIFGLFENTPAIPRSKASSNLASRDQVAALLWVRENIAAFGGNPSKVTIFGESAGAWSMRALLSALSAFGLYKNVISMSDPMAFPFSSPQVASSELGVQTMSALGCQGSDLACVQNRTVDEIQKAQLEAVQRTLAMPKNAWILSLAIYRPSVDGAFIPASMVPSSQPILQNSSGPVDTTRRPIICLVQPKMSGDTSYPFAFRIQSRLPMRLRIWARCGETPTGFKNFLRTRRITSITPLIAIPSEMCCPRQARI